MSVNSKGKRDKKKKISKKKANVRQHLRSQRSLELSLLDGMLPVGVGPNLTTPETIDDHIAEFCKSISPFVPFFVDVEPEPWSRQSCCDLNVKKYIEENGGEMVCGYKIWYVKDTYIEAERHALWRREDLYKEITFNVDGEESILFLPDIPSKQGSLELGPRKIRHGLNDMFKQMIQFQEAMEGQSTIEQMSDQECWDTMPTFEDWLKGARELPFYVRESQ